MDNNWTKEFTSSNEVNDGKQFASGDVITKSVLNKNFNNSFHALETSKRAEGKASNAVAMAESAVDNAKLSADKASLAQQSALESEIKAITSSDNANRQSSAAVVISEDARNLAEQAIQQANAMTNLAQEMQRKSAELIAAIALDKPIGGVFVPATGVVELTRTGQIILEALTQTITLTNNDDFKTGFGGKNQQLIFTAVTSGIFAGHHFNAGDELLAMPTRWIMIPNPNAVGGVKGNQENTYRMGLVNLTDKDIFTPEQLERINRVIVETNHIQDGAITQVKLAINSATGDRVGLDIARLNAVVSLTGEQNDIQDSKTFRDLAVRNGTNVGRTRLVNTRTGATNIDVTLPTEPGFLAITDIINVTGVPQTVNGQSSLMTVIRYRSGGRRWQRLFFKGRVHGGTVNLNFSTHSFSNANQIYLTTAISTGVSTAVNVTPIGMYHVAPTVTSAIIRFTRVTAAGNTSAADNGANVDIILEGPF